MQYHQSKRNLVIFSKYCHFSKKRPAGGNTTKVNGIWGIFLKNNVIEKKRPAGGNTTKVSGMGYLLKMVSFSKKTTRRRQYH